MSQMNRKKFLHNTTFSFKSVFSLSVIHFKKVINRIQRILGCYSIKKYNKIDKTLMINKFLGEKK